MNRLFDADSVCWPGGADYSSPRCRPLPERANRLDGDSIFSFLLMLYFCTLGCLGVRDRILEREWRGTPLCLQQLGTNEERRSRVSGLGTRKERKGKPGPGPLNHLSPFPPSFLTNPLFFDTLFTSALLMAESSVCRWRPKRRNTTNDALMPDGDDRSTQPGHPHFASVVVGLGLRRRQGPRQAKKLVLPTSHPPHSSPFPCPQRLLTLHSIGAP